MMSRMIAVPNCIQLINLRELILKSKSEELTTAAECISIQSYVAELLGIIGNITLTRVGMLDHKIPKINHIVGSQAGVKLMSRTTTPKPTLS